MYSRGAQGIAEQLNITVNEAQAITNAFYDAFPKIKQCIEDSHEMARTKGYVETVYGRKRRLPEMQLPEYDFKIKDATKLVSFDALDFDTDISDPQIPEERKQYFRDKLKKAWGYKQKQVIKDEALAEGIEIIDNGGKIADASRQCLNSRVQGSSADMSKLAMIAVHNDSKLNELGFRLLIPVHDELIGEAPIENAFEAADRLNEIMLSVGSEMLGGFKLASDAEISEAWYGASISRDDGK